MAKRIAVCFHGFLRSGAAMWWVARRLRAEGWAEVATPTLGYHLRSIEENAALAAAVVEDLVRRHPDAELSLVTHSYGGVLARVAWHRHALPKLRRGVCLSPPNRGARAAEMARAAFPVHRHGWDPLGQILPGVPDEWPLPPGEIGILTGGTGTPRGINPLLGADNDGTVCVEEARHPDAAAFLVLPVHHSLTIFAPSVLDRIVSYLVHGRFTSP